MFGKVVLEVERHAFEHAIDEMKERVGVTLDPELTADDLKELVGEFKEITRQAVGREFPTTPVEQLRGRHRGRLPLLEQPPRHRSIAHQQDRPRPRHGRQRPGDGLRQHGRTTSATGVAFTRNPSTGEQGLFGEYLRQRPGRGRGGRRPHAQAASSRCATTPTCRASTTSSSRRPSSWSATTRTCRTSSSPIEQGKLYMLQTRNGKRTGPAAVRIAVEMANEGLIDRATAVQRVEPAQLDQLLHPMIDPKAAVTVLATGPASPGAAVGQVVFDADEAKARGEAGEKVDPGARRDLAGGLPRHGRGAGDPDGARWHDLARRRRRARHGQAVRRRLRRAEGQLRRRARSASARHTVKAGTGSRSTAAAAG